MERLVWIIQVDPVSSTVFKSGKGIRKESQKDGSVRRNGLTLLALKMEGGREPRNVGSLWRMEKAREHTLYYSLQKGTQPC